MGTIVECEQGTDIWKACRAGYVTGSKMKALLTLKADKSDSEARKDYKAQLISEMLSGEPQDDDIGNLKAIKRGNEFEPIARADYEYLHKVDVTKVGFVQHSTIGRYGCSPDGLVGTVGGTEFKVPYPKNHIAYLLEGVLPKEYEPQVMTELSCNELAEWWDFISFCPEIPQDNLRQFTVRVWRKDHLQRIAEIEDKVIKFNQEVQAILDRLLAL